MREMQNRDPQKRPRYIYECEDCAFWHITTAQEFVEKPKSADDLPPMVRRGFRPRPDGTLEEVDLPPNDPSA
jgi:hypothetical protein